MAENRETTIIDVKLDAGKVAQDLGDMITRIQALKKQQSDLNSEIKAGNDTNGQYSRKLIEVKDQLAWCEKQAKGLSATTKLLNADTQTYDSSLNGQRQKLADMQKAYAQLDAVQRESDGGRAFLKSIDAQSESVKALEAAMGDHRRNVGNYPSAFNAVLPSLGKFNEKMTAMQSAIKELGSTSPKAFKDFASGVKGATAAGLKFIATPLGAAITAIVVVIKTAQAIFEKLAQAFKKNDEAGTNLARLMASFQPIMTAINKLFDGLASVLGKLAGKLADIVAGFSDEAAAAQQLVTNIDNLEETERQYTVKSAERNKEIARLRAEAAESTDLDVRKVKLQEAIELEKQNLAEQKEIAKQRLDNLIKTAEQEADTSDETTNKIASARAALYQAEESYFSGVRKLNSELKSIGIAQVAQQEANAKELTELQKKQAEDEAKIRQQAEDFAASLIEDETERELEQTRLKGEREIEELQVRLETEKTLTAEARETLSWLIEEKERQLQEDLQQIRDDAAVADAEKERERQIFIAEQHLDAVEQMRQTTEEEQAEYETARWEAQKATWALQMEEELAQIDLTEQEKLALQAKWNAVLEAAEQAHQDKLVSIEQKANKKRANDQKAVAQASAQFMGELSDILADYGEDSKEAAIASKALAIGKIAVETGIAIASGVAQAQSVPYPANIAAIITTITAVMTNIASAISTVKSAKFASGGVVEGGSYGQGDTVNALLSPQEVVLNPTQQAQTLFAIANGANVGANENLAEIVVAAVSAQPAPVLEYSEFTTFQKNVAQYTELAKI